MQNIPFTSLNINESNSILSLPLVRAFYVSLKVEIITDPTLFTYLIIL